MSKDYLKQDLIKARQELADSQALKRQAGRYTGTGLAIAGLLAGAAELVPNHTIKGIMDLGAIALGFGSAVGPGLDYVSISLDVVRENRHEVRHLEHLIVESVLEA